MSNRTRYILTLVTLVFAGVIIYFSRHQIVRSFDLLSDLNLTILFSGVIIIQLLSYLSNAFFYKTFFESFNLKVSTVKLYKMSLALNYVNNVLPSVGVSGASWMSYVLSDKVPSGKSTLSQLARYVLTYITFIGLLTVGTLGLYFGGSISRITVRISVLLALVIIFGSAFIAYVITKEKRINQAVHFVVGVAEKITNFFKSEKVDLVNREKLTEILEEFHDGYTLMRKEKSLLKGPLLYSFLGNVFEVATVYVVFLAFGEWVNFGAVVLGYAIANLGGLIAIVPGSVGIYEAAMVTVMSTAGIPVALSLSVTLIYRISSMAIFLPTGFYFYNDLMKERGEIYGRDT